MRSQVTEGLNLASDLKAGVGEVFAQTGDFTGIDLAAIGISGAAATKSGKYVSAIDVTNGVITITYAGSQANAKLSASGANQLTLSPGENGNGDVVWVCGYAATPSGVSGVATSGTTVVPKYLPATCRAS
ncbi:MAG: pilin [Bryobacterales bacterium]|nr:pilin [Bryobacterales bacterium]